MLLPRHLQGEAELEWGFQSLSITGRTAVWMEYGRFARGARGRRREGEAGGRLSSVLRHIFPVRRWVLTAEIKKLENLT